MKSIGLSLLACLIFSLFSCEKRPDLSAHGVLVPLTVMEDLSLPSIHVNGVKLHSEAFGDPSDPIILVIHGGPGADYRSNLNFKQLADDGYYVVFYDQMGAGLSQRLDASHYVGVQIYIDELDGVINHYRQNSQQKVILAGHSWGAMLAAAYLNQNPTKIDHAILTEPGGFNWDQTLTYIAKTRKIKLFGEGTNDVVYQDQFITGSDHNILDYKMILSTAGESATGDLTPPSFWRYGAVSQSASFDFAAKNTDQMDFTTNLKAFLPKVLFVYSELNTAYGLEHAQLLSSEFSNVELVEIKDCGHEVPQYGWQSLYPAIKNYLQ